VLRSVRANRQQSRRKPSRRGHVKRLGMRRKARFDTTVHIEGYATVGRSARRQRGRFSFARLLAVARGERAKTKRLRSTRRLGRVQGWEHLEHTTSFEATAPFARAASHQPSGRALHLNKNAVFNVLVLSLLVWGIVWFFASDRFYIRHVRVVGNRRVSQEALQEATGLYGYSVFWVNPRKVVADVLENVPPVRRVRVKSGLPNLVTLEVEEEGEQVMWEVAGGRYWIDEEGELHPVGDGIEPNLVIKDARAEVPDLADLSAVAGARQLSELLPELSQVEYTPISGLRFTHPRGWVVYLGTGDDMARKANVLRAMEVQFAGETVEQPSLVDLRFPDCPYFRLASEGTGKE
jgi:cell division septal protein FtsQ